MRVEVWGVGVCRVWGVRCGVWGGEGWSVRNEVCRV